VSIFGPSVSAPRDAAAAQWIGPRLGAFGTIGGLVPDGFDDHVVVHQARADDDGPVAEIAEVARQHTTTPALIWFAIWDGYGWTTTSSLYRLSEHGLVGWLTRARDRRRHRRDDRRRHPQIRHGLEQVPRFELPNRSYHLVHGPIQAAAAISEPGSGHHQVPDLWWPDDHRWFVATDTDLDWTCVAGSTELITEVAALFADCSERVQRHLRNDQIA
jgi:hypothetical protein